ncbi:peroxisomal multifunctional enzyme type 2 [Folsomia candida]|uniref:peroxisomal multifunctional enzyme type 2 n=1 Tax=Folsomia candida TaxID=158441 RepID=UPI000B8F7672|nr:peroxisomal multifunctional enzyme type 2 [Folsomia candida]
MISLKYSILSKLRPIFPRLRSISRFSTISSEFIPERKFNSVKKLAYENPKRNRVKLSDLNRGTIPSYTFPEFTIKYDAKDVVNYAKSTIQVGSEEKELTDVNDSKFGVLPIFMLPVISKMMKDMSLQTCPDCLDFSKIVLAEIYLEVYRPFSKSGEFRVQPKLEEFVDRGTHDMAYHHYFGKDGNSSPLFFAQICTIELGQGGKGGSRTSEKGAYAAPSIMTPPEGRPDAIVPFKTVEMPPNFSFEFTENELKRDIFEFHNPSQHYGPKPAFSEKPNLHGRYYWASAVHLMLKQFAAGDLTRFKCSRVRFTSVVHPGDTLEIRAWHREPRIFFEAVNLNTGKLAMKGGFVDLIPCHPEQ